MNPRRIAMAFATPLIIIGGLSAALGPLTSRILMCAGLALLLLEVQLLNRDVEALRAKAASPEVR